LFSFVLPRWGEVRDKGLGRRAWIVLALVLFQTLLAILFNSHLVMGSLLPEHWQIKVSLFFLPFSF